ncbi:hypothetical protein BY996DRAFT_6939048 [Phakopsora pachyrhizi]|nr:hypothetical protein BY996DRAFT_8007413 [Phakopsora pachyrhizi]KAI8456956.1 hypothetical protein BY996DRAFT_6939048 [Phakopsora pachyrhizi]
MFFFFFYGNIIMSFLWGFQLSFFLKHSIKGSAIYFYFLTLFKLRNLSIYIHLRKISAWVL